MDITIEHSPCLPNIHSNKWECNQTKWRYDVTAPMLFSCFSVPAYTPSTG